MKCTLTDIPFWTFPMKRQKPIPIKQMKTERNFITPGVSNHKEKRPEDFSEKKEHDNWVPHPVFLSNVPKCLPIIVGVSYLIKRRGSSRKRGAKNGPCSPFLVFISKPFCLSHSIVQSEFNIISISSIKLPFKVRLPEYAL